jgi:hypothetical protein
MNSSMNKSPRKTTLAWTAALAATLLAIPLSHADPVSWLDAGTKWGFGNGPEFPGAKGDFTLGEVDSKKAATLNFDFTGGGGYVLGEYKDTAGTVKGAVTTVRFSVKGDTKAKVLVRITDASGECFQTKVDYTTPGQWQPVTFDLSKPQLVFGGDKNQKFDAPLNALYLGATAKGADLGGEKKGALSFADLDITQAPAQ